MRDQLSDFGDAVVVVITFAPPERLRAYRCALGLSIPVLSDVDLEMYRIFGIGRGLRRNVWSASTLKRYWSLLRKGRRLRRPTEDVYQLGGDAVVGRDGRLRYLAVASRPDARPPVSELIEALD